MMGDDEDNKVNMPSLFDDIEAPVYVNQQLEELRELERIQKTMLDTSFIPRGMLTKLSPSYLQIAKEASMKKGKKVLPCARCGKDIENQSQLVLDPHSGHLYGTTCFSRVQSRLNAIQIPHHCIEAPPEDHNLERKECLCCERNFISTNANTKKCGETTRCCFCCSFSLPKYKNQKCDFEKAISIGK